MGWGASGAFLSRSLARRGRQRQHQFRPVCGDAIDAREVKRLVLHGLGPGKLKIHADAGKRGKTQTELMAVAGQTLQWNLVIYTGVVLRGRVVDEDDKPVQAYVTASLANPSPKHEWSTYDRTDKDGWFQLRNCQPDRAIRIWVRAAAHAEKHVYAKPDRQDLDVGEVQRLDELLQRPRLLLHGLDQQETCRGQ